MLLRFIPLLSLDISVWFGCRLIDEQIFFSCLAYHRIFLWDSEDFLHRFTAIDCIGFLLFAIKLPPPHIIKLNGGLKGCEINWKFNFDHQFLSEKFEQISFLCHSILDRWTFSCSFIVHDLEIHGGEVNFTSIFRYHAFSDNMLSALAENSQKTRILTSIAQKAVRLYVEW